MMPRWTPFLRLLALCVPVQVGPPHPLLLPATLPPTLIPLHPPATPAPPLQTTAAAATPTNSTSSSNTGHLLLILPSSSLMGHLLPTHQRLLGILSLVATLHQVGRQGNYVASYLLHSEQGVNATWFLLVIPPAA